MRSVSMLATLWCGCGRIDFDPRGDGGVSDSDLLTYREAVLEDAPIAYWRLGDVATASDETGALIGTYSGDCAPAPGALAGDPDGAVHFDGLTCRVDFPGAIDFLGRSPFTIELWVALDELGGGQPYIMNEVRASMVPQEGFAMLEGNTAGATYFERAATGVNRVTQRFASTPGVFAHLVGTYDGTNLQLYANTLPVGVATTTATASMASTATTTVVLGSYPSTATSAYLHGTLDEVAIYDHVLPLDRIALHHAIGTLGPQ
jgi:hypothetical protein